MTFSTDFEPIILIFLSEFGNSIDKSKVFLLKMLNKKS